MKKVKRQSPLWLPAMDNSRRAGFIIGAFLVAIIGLCVFIYLSWTSDSTDDVHRADIIPDKSVLPDLPALKNIPLASTDAPESHEEVLAEYEPEADEEDNSSAVVESTVTNDQNKTLRLTDSRRKSGIVAPYTEPKILNSSSSIHQNQQEENIDEVDANVQFFKSATNKSVATSVANQIHHLEYKVLQGKMIEAVLEPRVNSDLPGMICATVQRDVYGEQGRNKLIPWGSRICGQYSTELKKGQGRLFAVWNTLRRPDGVQIAIDSMGADQLGTAGMGGYVDTHFAEMFSVSALLAIISASTRTPPPRYGHYDTSSYYYQDSVRRAATKTAEHLLEPYTNIAPTVTVPAGERIRIYVNKDLDFSMLAKQTPADIMMIP